MSLRSSWVIFSVPLRRRGEFIRLGFQSAVGADAEIIIGQQAIDHGDVVGDLGLAPVQFESFDFFVGRIVMGKNGVRPRRKRRKQQKAKKGRRPRETAIDARNERA